MKLERFIELTLTLTYTNKLEVGLTFSCLPTTLEEPETGWYFDGQLFHSPSDSVYRIYQSDDNEDRVTTWFSYTLKHYGRPIYGAKRLFASASLIDALQRCFEIEEFLDSQLYGYERQQYDFSDIRHR